MKTLMRGIKTALLICLIFPIIGKAQDSLRSEQKLSYQVNLNINGRILTGTFNQSVFASALEIKLVHGRWEWFNTTSYRYNNLGGSRVEDNWYELFTLTYFAQKRKSFLTAYYAFDNNLLLKVNSRHFGGLGMGIIHDKWTHTDLRVDMGLGYESTLYGGNNFENTRSLDPLRARSVFLVRIINGHNFFKGKVRIDNRIFYRQSLIEGADYYWLIKPTLSSTVAKNLSITISYEYRFENVYLSDLSPTNTVLLGGLTYRVRRE